MTETQTRDLHEALIELWRYECEANEDAETYYYPENVEVTGTGGMYTLV